MAITEREQRGLAIAALCRLRKDENGAWLVPSQSGDGKYIVKNNAEGKPTCTCPDFELRQGVCKHIYAVRYTIEREQNADGSVTLTETLTVQKKTTYPRDWSAYTTAQTSEKRRLYVLLRELCSGLQDAPEPEGKRGRKKTPMRDVIFACGVKVYSGFSSRRFGTDLQDAFERKFLSRSLHPNKVNCFMEKKEITPILYKLIEQSALPLRSVETTFAPDSTGFSTSRHVRWYDEKYGCTRSGHDWVKAHAICGTKTNVVTSVIIENRDAADCPQFKPLVEATAKNFNVQTVAADKAYLSRENLEMVDRMGATAYVPFKVNSVPGEAGSVWEKMFFYFNFRRDEFLTHYHQRSNIESTFSMVKAKFGDAVRSRTDVAMKNEVLVKFLLHNICCVHQSHVELGIEPVFWQNESEGPAALPMVRPG